jgi:dimethylhistidine N-methyltransferase
MSAGPPANFRFFDFSPRTDTFLEEVLAGLSRPQKSVPSKFFYDARGSQLFEAICELPEYYPTRTEIALLRRYAAQMASLLGPRCLLIEYGSGAGVKTRILVDALSPAGYVPIDISRGQLVDSGAALAHAYPKLAVRAVWADYSAPLELPNCADTDYRRRAVFFPGSTIGNFDADECRAFLRNARQVAGPQGALLIGVDLKKDQAVLHAAYNDTAGITAEFNRNLLVRINRELKGDFEVGAFRHRAFYDADKGRIEMHLQSVRAQNAALDGRRFTFALDETIHTEISCKYSVAEFQALASAAGWRSNEVWVDDAKLFSIHYMSA